MVYLTPYKKSSSTEKSELWKSAGKPERSRRQISQKTGYMVMDILHVDRVKIRWTEMKATGRSADRLSGGKIKIWR